MDPPHIDARASCRGNAVVEFSLVFVLFWTVLGGCFQIGYSAYVYGALVSALDGAARYAARVDFDTGHTFVGGIANMAATGSPEGGGAPLAPQLSPSNISVTWTTDTSGAPLTMTVSATNYSVNALFQTVKFSGKPSITVRYAGSYKP
jgi:Flp pilus assembly protein TadG